MKKIIHNVDNLKYSEINNVVKRSKALIMNSKDEILLVSSANNYHLPGGHVEKNESDQQCLTRELKEELGIDVEISIEKPFCVIEYLKKDYPNIGDNTWYIANYYEIKMDVEPDITQINLTEEEKQGKFTSKYIHKDNIMKELEESLNYCTLDNVVKDTIDVVREYLTNISKPLLYLITGPAGVGKSTISKEIAKNLNKSVLIEGDDIYNQFVGGRISPWKENAPLDLFWDNCKLLINNYLSNGYNVVFNYIIKQNQFNELKKYFKDYNIKFIVLMVDEKTILKRDKERPIDCQMNERSLILLNEFMDQHYPDKYILNSSELSIQDTVLQILDNDRFVISKMDVDKIKTANDVFTYMNDNIDYGWLDIYNEKHINNMKNFRKMYRTSSLEEIFANKIGTCIEQVWLMKNLLDKINVNNKMFCTRIYEDSSKTYDGEEHMHCFILYYDNNKVYHMEYPNFLRKGIYEYKTEEEAIRSINDYYVNLSGGIDRPITQFYEVEPNLSFKEFNNYINSLDRGE